MSLRNLLGLSLIVFMQSTQLHAAASPIRLYGKCSKQMVANASRLLTAIRGRSYVAVEERFCASGGTPHPCPRLLTGARALIPTSCTMVRKDLLLVRGSPS